MEDREVPVGRILARKMVRSKGEVVVRRMILKKGTMSQRIILEEEESSLEI
jgi:hypothetical protein